MLRQLLLAAELEAGALDVKGLVVDKQLVAVGGLADFHLGGTAGLRSRIAGVAGIETASQRTGGEGRCSSVR